MEYFEFVCPVKILSGPNALENIPVELGRLSASRPLILTDKGVSEAGLTDLVIDAFTDSGLTPTVMYRDVPPNSSVETVTTVAELYNEHDCDAIIAVGGGSVIDTAKGANIMVSEGISEFTERIGADILQRKLKPLIVVPTTAGTGSEATSGAVIYDTAGKQKLLLGSERIIPDSAILDPRMTVSLPPKLTAATGMDALAHAVEAYTCLQRNPISDIFATRAISLIADYLLPAVRDGKDEEARFMMANGSLMAGIAFSNAMVGAIHAFSHAAGAVGSVPHGGAIAIFLPIVIEYNMEILAHRYGDLLLYLAGSKVFAQTPEAAAGDKFVEYVRRLTADLNEECGQPLSLKEYGLTEKEIETIADTALDDGSILMNPKNITREDGLILLRKAL